MWIKLTEEQIDSLIKRQIDVHKKNIRQGWGVASIAMIVLSGIINLIFFFPNKLNLARRIPTLLETVENTLLVFLILEMILLILCGVEAYLFKRKTPDEMRKYILKQWNSEKRMLCPRCGLIFKDNTTKCSQCGQGLGYLRDYTWIDDTPKGSDPLGDPA